MSETKLTFDSKWGPFITDLTIMSSKVVLFVSKNLDLTRNFGISFNNNSTTVTKEQLLGFKYFTNST